MYIKYYGNFDKRIAFKPFEYPEVDGFRDAINHSYWLVSEWNFIGDIQDFNTKLTPEEKNIVKNTLLAISQIEVSVKRFWAKIGERFPKAEIEQVGLTFGESECYDEQTEILTNQGWKYFNDLNINDKVAQYDIQTGEITFTHTLSGIKRPYKGELHLYEGENTSIAVTPNHEMIVRCESENFHKILSKEVSLEKLTFYPKSGKFSQNDTILNMLLPDSEDGQFKSKTIINYDGYVYCVTVPSGNIVTRRFGNIAICGNCRHENAYSKLLEVLSLNADFENLLEIPAIQGRVDYLTKYLTPGKSNKEYMLTLTLFSIFIENISLFSQFLIIKSFNKEKNVLKDIDNVVQATQQEEQTHALFGVWLVKQVKKEHPDWFDDEFYSKLYAAAEKSYTAESKIIDWIFEQGEPSFISKDIVKEFIKERFNESLKMVGGKKLFTVDKSLTSKVKWFTDELHGQVSTDFFYKKPVTYSKFTQPITEKDLF